MRVFVALTLYLLLAASARGADPVVNDGPARAGEWGFRPSGGKTISVTPPAFSWKPQKKASSYELEVAGAGDPIFYDGIGFNVFCPPSALAPGEYSWRFRFRVKSGAVSKWSRSFRFSVADGAKPFPFPDRETLLARIPREHPRLFLRPENLPQLRKRARGGGKDEFEKLERACEKLLKNPPSTGEPSKYPKDMKRRSEAWRVQWWGNRKYTVKLLESATTLAFTGLLNGNEEYRILAKRLLLDASEWDPHGATGYVYNDEAGMPYAYHFSRAYTFLRNELTEEERERCRKVMRARGREMFTHLCPRHLWYPYSSHSNRAWHFLGEVGIAFFKEIPEAADWVWFASNVFRCVYPVWCDDDGGWHEGMTYWRSYIGRFTWWAMVMKSALGLDAYKKPYFSQVGYYPMYMTPPGHRGGGFGDLCARRASRENASLMALFASQAQNSHWQWYADAHGGAPTLPGYYGFLAKATAPPEAKKPIDLPTSRHFRGTGQAILNATLLEARKNVQVMFKSSPFGSQSHGYEAQNAFLLNVFGERILVRSGYRDIYGSAHHKMWMWETKSVNSVTVNGKGQIKHSRSAVGRILEFRTGPVIDYVSGEAGRAYGPELRTFTRRILFIKPDRILLFDTLTAPEPSTFQWHLHSPYEFRIGPGPNFVSVEGKTGASRIRFLAPRGLRFSKTNEYDPPPRERVKLREWHLTAATAKPSPDMDFIVMIRPHAARGTVEGRYEHKYTRAGFVLKWASGNTKAQISIRTGEGALPWGMTSEKRIAVKVTDGEGKQIDAFECEEGLEEGF